MNGMATGTHTKVTSTMGELYVGVANDILRLGIGAFPTASSKVEGLAGPPHTA
jgi:hypothetical protein